MSKKFIIENNINNTIIYKKYIYDCLSMKQKSHMKPIMIRKIYTDYLNSNENNENSKNININININ